MDNARIGLGHKIVSPSRGDVLMFIGFSSHLSLAIFG